MNTNRKLNFSVNSEIVLNIITFLKKYFEEEMYPKYNQKKCKMEDFYANKRHTSFAYILNTVFENIGIYYESYSFKGEFLGQVLLKIGDTFYNANGIANDLFFNEESNFKICPTSYYPFYIEHFCNHQEHNNEMEQELIIAGKNALQQIYQNSSDSMTRKLVTANANPSRYNF